MKRIIVAGLYRSGSTWMYNAIRLIIEHSGHTYTGGGYTINDPDKDYNIIKEHRWMPELAEGATVFTSFRDPSEVAKSYKRFSGKHLNMKRALKDYYRWEEVSEYCMLYEFIKLHPRFVMSKICRVLGLAVDIAAVLDELKKVKPPQQGYDPKTLLFKNHITQ